MPLHVLFALQLALIVCAAAALALWCGWGIARLTLPPALRPFAGLLAAPIGYALVVVAGYWAVRTVSGLGPALVLVIAVTGALNIAAWRRDGPPALGDAREHLPLLALLLVTLLVGVAPLLSYGHPAIIGGGWDTENYLPTARYLERGPVSAIAGAPDNPLRDINADPPRIGLTLGFSIWHGSVDLLTRSEALVSFAPLLAWLRALGVLALYVLLRAVLGLGRWPALVAALWAAAGALLLWVSYFNFGMQLAAWPLVPLVLTLGVAAAEDLADRGRAGRAGLLPAALALAALPVAYYPALTLVAPLAAGVGAAVVAQRWERRGSLLAAALVLMAGASALAAPTFLDYTRGFGYRYGEQLTTLGLFHFIGPAEALGLTMFERSPAAPPKLLHLPLVGVAVALGLMGLGAAHGPQRARWLGLALGAVAVLAWVRWMRAYPYAYMKVWAYSGWVFLGLAGAGWQTLLEAAPRRTRALAAAPALLLAALLAVGQQQVVAEHWARPGLYAAELPALYALRTLVPAGSTVTLTSDERVQGVAAGLAAYLLDHASVIGRVRTGYARSAAGAPGQIGEFGLLHADEDPAPWGFRDAIWRGGSFALYRRPLETAAHMRLDLTLAPEEALTLTIGDAQLARGDVLLPGGAARALTLAIATIDGGELLVAGRQLPLPAGVSTLRLPAIRTPQLIEIRNLAGSPVLLRHATLTSPPDTAARAHTHSAEYVVAYTPALLRAALRPPGTDGGAASVTPAPASVVASASVLAAGSVVTTTINTLLPDSGPLVAALDIWDARGQQYGWYGAVIGVGPAPQSLRVALDVSRGTASALSDDDAAVPLGASFAGLRPGTYTARLHVGVEDIALLVPADLFEFVVAPDGQTQIVWTSDTPLLAASTDRPAQRTDVWLADDVHLRGYTLASASVRPGEDVRLVLWWYARRSSLDERSVMIHLLNERGERVAQADSPPAQGMRPTSQWRAGEYVLDARRIRLPADLPPGVYTLAVGMYRWPSLDRLPLTEDGQRAPGDFLRIPVAVSR